MALMSKPQNTTIQAATSSQRISLANPNRKRYMIQNQGPGNAFVGESDYENVLAGIKVANGATWIDDPPWVHCGEVWVTVDTANTVVVFAEWN